MDRGTSQWPQDDSQSRNVSLVKSVVSSGSSPTGRKTKPRFGKKDLQPHTAIPVAVCFGLSDLIGSPYVPRHLLGTTQLIKLWRRQTNGANSEASYYDIYIGRACYQGGWNLPRSDYANPYDKTDINGNILASLNNYRAFIMSRDDLRNGLVLLYGKTLGCWCTNCTVEQDLPVPEQYTCHGQVLLEIMAIMMLSSGMLSLNHVVN